MPTMMSLFSGGGLADVGYRMAGYEPIAAVEYDPAIAEVYAANVGPHVRVESALASVWRTFERPDLLHASPECKEFSRAKQGGQEGKIQRRQAEAICAALETLTPRCFVLENVVGYRRSASLARILATLERLGYWYDLANINSADMGVAQTRVRVIVRAVRGGLVPHLPRPVPWVGWYRAVEDLLPTLPESQFAAWQLARLPEWIGESVLVGDQRSNNGVAASVRAGGAPALTVDTRLCGKTRAFLIGGGNTQLAQVDSKARDAVQPAFTVAGNDSACTNQRAWLVAPHGEHGDLRRDATEPAHTIAATHLASKHRAFIVDGKANSDGEKVTVRGDREPCFTVAAHANKQASRAWLAEGRVVAMTPRALARFMGLGDGYALPERKALACQVIGNGVCPPVAEAIGRSLLSVLG